jgi:hypothetical protein
MEVVVRTVDPIPEMTFVTNTLSHHTGGFFSPPFLTDDPDKRSHARIQHLAWEYPSIDQLLETWSRLKDIGIESITTVCHGVSWSFYYRDPDNHLVELTTDAYDEPPGSLRHMKHNPQFKANPQGAFIDPLKVLAARKQGLDLDELRERAFAGDYDVEVMPDPLATF